LDGFNEQTINHRAGWSKGSKQMLSIYGNFSDQEMNDSVYEKYGLKTDDKRHVTLPNCPRCGNILRDSDRFCGQCSLVLDHEMNSKVEYRKKNSSWGSVLLLKARELSHHLVGKRKTIEFNKPVYVGKGDDSDLLRKKIIDMPYTEWKKMGFSKGTLHYMKQNAKSDKPFTLNAHTKKRI